MSRFTIPSRDNSPSQSQPLLDAVGAQFGVIPNLFRLVGKSPAALEGLLGLNGALGKALDLKTREAIALAVAGVNGCDYCTSAHSYIGANMAKIDEAELALNRLGRSGDAKLDIALAFARKVAKTRGKVPSTDLDAVRAAGFSDAQVIEILCSVALNMLTNIVNNVADTEIDFPVVRADAA